MLRDFERLGIRTVTQLARAKPARLYEKLCEVTGQPQDICCLDVSPPPWRRRAIRNCPRRSAIGGIGAAAAKRVKLGQPRPKAASCR